MNTTESPSKYDNLEKMTVREILTGINQEDFGVATAVRQSMDSIERLVEAIFPKLQSGGRLFYIGAGTSGRLGILDASECPPTFGVPHGMIIGIIAGGDTAIRKAVEFAEDDTTQAWKDLQAYDIHSGDVVVGIAASGKTPYVCGGLDMANKNGVLTGAIVCNADSPVAAVANFPVEVIVGPEFLTGSTRMKAGTAQKLVLNMITTSLMIKLGRVKGNKMVDMQLSNQKLVLRGERMLMEELNIEKAEAEKLLKVHGSVRRALEATREERKN